MKNIRRMVFAVLAATLPLVPSGAQAAEGSCWGQATRILAQMGEMGEHASGYPTPREGLRNLARALYEQEILEADSMQALGAFVAESLGLEVAACR